MTLTDVKSRANDFRIGADGQLGPLNYSFLQGFRRFRDDTGIHLGVTPGINLNPAAASLTSFNRDEPARGSVNYTRFSLQTLVAERVLNAVEEVVDYRLTVYPMVVVTSTNGESRGRSPIQR